MQIELWNFLLECLLEGMYVLHLSFLGLCFLDLVGNRSYNNLFFRSLLKNIGPSLKRMTSGQYFSVTAAKKVIIRLIT